MAFENSLLSNLAEEYGTPLYVYDGDLVARRYHELYDFIPWPGLKILYAMKANYNPAILQLLHEEGACLDTVSPAEVILAQRIGFLPEEILYTANNLTEAEMREVESTGVLMNIGSLSRLEKFGRAFPGSRVCVRFNPDVVAGAHAKIRTGGDLTKFGILMSNAGKVASIVRGHDLTVVGLHSHTGSGISETGKVYESIRNLLSVARTGYFPDLEFVDFGGGFKVPYHPDEPRIDYPAFGQTIGEMFSEFCEEYGRKLEMYFEPGKYIVAEAGHLLVTVNTLKDNRGRMIAGTDSGFPQLIRPMFYDAYHHIENISNPDGPEGKYDICGNICETGDRFAEQRSLSEVREGDLLSLQNAGAYCYSMGGIYNMRPMPAEVLVRKGRSSLVTPRMANSELADSILGV